jgi:hypothetical protein
MTDAMNSKKLGINCCAFCGVVASNKCAACSLVVYCSKEHQKAHWNKHKKECISYEVISIVNNIIF